MSSSSSSISSSSMSAATEQPCIISLYQTTGDHAAPVQKISLSCTRSSASKAHQLMCAYLEVSSESDTQLIQRLATNEQNYDQFELQKKGDRGRAFVIRFTDDREAVFPPISSQLRVRAQTVSLKVSSDAIFDTQEATLCRERIEVKRMDDNAIVAMFNSDSFQKLVETNATTGAERTIEKIDAVQEKKQ